MDLFTAIDQRRSVRKFKNTKFPDSCIQKAISAALLAPNSSNTQTWDFFWVQSPEKKQKLVNYCLNQAAARTASDLLVAVADPKKWRRSQKPLIEWVRRSNAPEKVELYYQKIIPLTYSWGLFNLLAPLKWLVAFIAGLFQPVPRGPYSKRDIQEVAIKSTALACENFVLAVSAQQGATCMMEGFDENRVQSLLNLPSSARVVMVIAIGYPEENGTWGPRFRLDEELVVHKV